MLFQSTPPARGATNFRHLHRVGGIYFNPRPPRGGATLIDVLSTMSNPYFNPRPPRGGRPHTRQPSSVRSYISIHAPREGGDVHAVKRHIKKIISIHAPREGGDGMLVWLVWKMTISIHAPREGGDNAGKLVAGAWHGFQSTPPARGATPLCTCDRAKRCYFNPRPPRGGRPPLYSTTSHR